MDKPHVKQTRKGFGRHIRHGVLILVFFITVFVQSTQMAHAQCPTLAPPVVAGIAAASTAQVASISGAYKAAIIAKKPDLLAQLAQYGTIASGIVSAITFIVTLGGLLGDGMSTAGATIVTAKHLAANASLEAGAATIQNHIEVGQATVVAQIAGENLVNQNGHMCAVQTISQSRTSITTFSQMVTAFGVESIRTRNNGNGPAYVGKQTALDCNGIFADPTVCPVTLANALSTPSATLTGANLRFSTFDGQNAFEFPGTQTDPKCTSGDSTPCPQVIKTPTKDEQKLYMAAIDYCMLTAGPRPQPPATSTQISVTSNTSPTDLTKLQLFRRAMMIETSFAYQCAHRVAKLTRPPDQSNDSNGTFQIIRQAGKDACTAYATAAKAIPATSGATSTDAFAGLPNSLATACKGSQNLSLYEVELMDVLGCQFLTAAEAGNVGGGNAGNSALTTNRYLCTQIRNQWEFNENQELSNFAHSLKSLQQMQSAYAGTDASASMRSAP